MKAFDISRRWPPRDRRIGSDWHPWTPRSFLVLPRHSEVVLKVHAKKVGHRKYRRSGLGMQGPTWTGSRQKQIDIQVTQPDLLDRFTPMLFGAIPEIRPAPQKRSNDRHRDHPAPRCHPGHGAQPRTTRALVSLWFGTFPQDLVPNDEESLDGIAAWPLGGWVEMDFVSPVAGCDGQRSVRKVRGQMPYEWPEPEVIGGLELSNQVSEFALRERTRSVLFCLSTSTDNLNGFAVARDCRGPSW
ncbi:MAG: hypothetical protein P4L84_29985 [Isosphaeraceae bacterium]|nr:hypothetical protein [Isosphaeraceae bacterium]